MASLKHRDTTELVLKAFYTVYNELLIIEELMLAGLPLCDNWRMRPFGTSEQLAERRQRAFRLLRKGMTPIQVARKVGVTPPSVRRWRRAARQPVHPASRRPGRPCRLSAPQQQELVQALERGAQAAGWANDYWTVDRITHLIWDLFHVRYDPSGVWHLLQRLGWSCQKPQRRSLARKEEAVAHWKHYTWPQIKKVAAA